MHSDWKGPFQRRLQKASSERGRRMANARWKRDRIERNRMALLTAEQYPSRIAERIIVIRNETEVLEVTIWNWESGRSVMRKRRSVMNGPIDLIPNYG